MLVGACKCRVYWLSEEREVREPRKLYCPLSPFPHPPFPFPSFFSLFPPISLTWEAMCWA